MAGRVKKIGSDKVKYRAPKGTRDILPAEAAVWSHIEALFRHAAARYGYGEIRTPAFEDVQLFIRSIGSDTDIVSKEMYDFVDKGGRRISLKPEGTAPVVRAFIQNNLQAVNPLTKLFYISPMFRYDRPQAGRYRQFHQLGVEAIGSDDPLLDMEVIMLAISFLRAIGLKHTTLLLNSVACGNCRPRYVEALKDFLAKSHDDLCEDCRRRYTDNPLRLLDCKNPACKALLQKSPQISAYICGPCREHFDKVRKGLDSLGIAYTVDPSMVRGLDYYTRTAFEITHDGLGAQSSIAGGGRYDRLIKECGGPDLTGMGFAAGLERLLLALEAEATMPARRIPCSAYLIALGERARINTLSYLYKLRDAGLHVEYDYLGRSLKAQMRAADRLSCRFAVIIGDDELERGTASIKDLAQGSQTEVQLTALVDYLLQ